jgi:hypothetical protein
MKRFIFHVKAEKSPIEVQGTRVEEEGRYTKVLNGDDVVFCFSTTSLKGWREDQAWSRDKTVEELARYLSAEDLMTLRAILRKAQDIASKSVDGEQRN